MSGILLGLLFGTAMLSEPNMKDLENKLNGIPIRCLGLLEVEIEQYRTCRRPSMVQEVNRNWGSYEEAYWEQKDCWDGWGHLSSKCVIDKNLDWEIKSLLGWIDAAKIHR